MCDKKDSTTNGGHSSETPQANVGSSSTDDSSEITPAHPLSEIVMEFSKDKAEEDIRKFMKAQEAKRNPKIYPKEDKSEDAQ